LRYAPNVGFSPSEPWLPIGPSHRALAIDVQEESADSNLQFARE
jgi:alpha-glucosidase